MAVRLFAEFVGPKFPAKAIDKAKVRDWKNLLIRYPVKAAEMNVFKGMSLKRIVEENEKHKKPVISRQTVNRYMSGVGAFTAWLRVNDYIKEDPTEGLYLGIDKDEVKKRPFTTDELNKLFRAPLFTGCLSREKFGHEGSLVIDGHEYWLPLVMLYSGARPAEIAQLLVTDVRNVHDQWIMHVINTGDDDRSVKTKSAKRIIPIHSQLIRLGFIDYHARMVAAGAARLFPDAERNQRGQMAAKFSREFTRKVLKRAGIHDPRKLSLYSFRHGFIDALRRAEYLDDQIGFLVGHAGKQMTGRYGQIPQGMLRQRVEMIERVDYPGLDIEHLVRS